jgi:hypothetical protein
MGDGADVALHAALRLGCAASIVLWATQVLALQRWTGTASLADGRIESVVARLDIVGTTKPVPWVADIGGSILLRRIISCRREKGKFYASLRGENIESANPTLRLLGSIYLLDGCACDLVGQFLPVTVSPLDTFPRGATMQGVYTCPCGRPRETCLRGGSFDLRFRRNIGRVPMGY